MKQKLSFSKVLFILLIVTCALLGSVWLYQKIDKDSGIKEELSFYQKIEQLKPELLMYWHEGDFAEELQKGHFNCKNLKKQLEQTDSSFLQCNLDYLNCVIKNKKSWKGLTLSKASYYSTSHEKASMPNNFGAKVEVRFKKYSRNLYLKDFCNEVLLPERVYVNGAGENWDSFGRQILIDRFLVSKRQVFHWKNQVTKKVAKSLPVSMDKNPDLPATDLSFEERKKFCRWQGKTLLESKTLIAATSLPSKQSDPKNRYNKIYSYPWTKNSKISYELNWSNCSRLMSKDCLEKFSYKPFSTSSVSWIGLYQVAGGYPESVVNYRIPAQNIRTSSFYFDLKSTNQHISSRAFWNGDIKSNFYFSSSSKRIRSREKYEESESVKQIGFRCMREL